MPSCGSAEATRQWSRAFTADSFLACRPLHPGEFDIDIQIFDADIFRLLENVSATAENGGQRHRIVPKEPTT